MSWIGNRPPTWRPDGPGPAGVENPPAQQPLGPLADATLAVIATWRDQGAQGDPSTPQVAQRLGIQANTPERADLNDALTFLKKRGLVKYETEADGLHHWRTAAGRRAS
jgi:hypothetical protein